MSDLTSSNHGRTNGVPRPRMHLTPTAGWMNDPNGLIKVDDTYHLYFQHNPDDTVWGNIHWAHATSTDLLHWEHHPIAMAPDHNGMIFSGSVVRDVEGVAGFGPQSLVALFTQDRDGLQTQSVAGSVDGFGWKMFEHNPVLDTPKDCPDYRDPAVFRFDHGDEKWWSMALAVGTEVWFYRSHDLIEWELTSTFEPVMDHDGWTVEVPTFLPVPHEVGHGSSWMLVYSVIAPDDVHDAMNSTRWIVGDFDGLTFHPVVAERSQRFDLGPHWYAPMAWVDGLQTPVIIGWMNEASVVADGRAWCGRQSIPREVTLHDDEGTLVPRQRPLLLDELGDRSELVVAPRGEAELVIDQTTFLLQASLTASSLDTPVVLDLHNGQGDRITMSHDGNRLLVESEQYLADLRADAGDLVQVLVDAGSVEIFVGDGLEAASFISTLGNTSSTLLVTNAPQTALALSIATGLAGEQQA